MYYFIDIKIEEDISHMVGKIKKDYLLCQGDGK